MPKKSGRLPNIVPEHIPQETPSNDLALINQKFVVEGFGEASSAERLVGADVIVVGDVLTERAPQGIGRERDDATFDLAPGRADEAFHVGVAARTVGRGLSHDAADRAEALLGGVDGERVSIHDHGRGSSHERIIEAGEVPAALGDPLSVDMVGHAEQAHFVGRHPHRVKPVAALGAFAAGAWHLPSGEVEGDQAREIRFDECSPANGAASTRGRPRR